MHKVLRILILSDLFILGSFGLVQPIFAVYMLQNITGTTISAIGIAITIQLVTKASVQILVAKWTDREPGNRRELWTLFAGSILMSLVSFGYIFADSIPFLYFLQFLYGFGAAMAFPGWVVIYTRYLRSEKAGYEWSVYGTIISLGTAVAASVGAYMAEAFSFTSLFVLMGTLSLIGSSLISYIFKHEFTRHEKRTPGPGETSL